MNPTFGERALRFYLRIIRFFWRPIRGAARVVVRHPWRSLASVVIGLLAAFILKTAGVAAAEGGSPTFGRVLIGVGGVVDLVTTTFVGMVGAALLYWFIIAVGLVQIPVGEIMEVLRELGQMLRLQDPVQRDREGNIRAVDTNRLLGWGMLLLVVPGMALMSTVWLGVFPTWHVYAMLLLISVGGLAYGIFAAARGRRVGVGLDLLMGLNGYLVVGGIITLLTRLVLHGLYPHSVAVVRHGTAAPGGGNFWDSDVQLARYLAEVAAHGGFGGVALGDYPGALLGLVVVGLVGLVALALHLTTIVALIRILRRPPERDRAMAAQKGEEIAAGNHRGPGLDWYGALIAAIVGLGVTAALWLVGHYWVSEWTCRFGDIVWSFAAFVTGIAVVAALLRSRWPRAATVVAMAASALLVFGYVTHVLDSWRQDAVACAAPAPVRTEPSRPRPEPTPTVTAAAPVSVAPRATSIAEPPRPRVDESGAIASYFASHRSECPETAGRTWHQLRNARLACTAESVRR